jgi:hypothetical protein
MPDLVKKVTYCYVQVPNRAGQGEKLLACLREAGVNLVAYTGFPVGRGLAQLDFVAEDMAALRRVARKHGWRVSAPKRAFVFAGDDRAGAAHGHIRKLASAKISVTAADAVAAGKGRYGMILWVAPRYYARAAKALGAR